MRAPGMDAARIRPERKDRKNSFLFIAWLAAIRLAPDQPPLLWSPANDERRRFEANGPNTRGDVQPFIALDTYRLKRNGLIETAYKHIGAGPDADRRTRSCAGIITLQCARTDIRNWRNDGPAAHRQGRGARSRVCPHRDALFAPEVERKTSGTCELSA